MCSAFNGFPVEIWGTVSDWVTAVVAGLTGWFIWQTLKEQKKVSEEQQTVTYLQQLKFILDIQPVFSYFLSTEGMSKGYYCIKLSKGFAYELKINNILEGYDDDFFIERDEIKSVPIDRIYEVLKDNPKHKELQTQINIDVFFKDALQYQYLQKIRGQFPDIVIDPPFMIDKIGNKINFYPPNLNNSSNYTL